eukprot:TRINITY_DN1603_c1_g1_i1.p1 TRINITY_DN1603_c1_g1~~TRINITY_DN1603_c1_g1_i1.p1  ORF type:complete len:263 (+),score=106.50 TRINITY_DN1603_c1_g1_i1:92-790(+)
MCNGVITSDVEAIAKQPVARGSQLPASVVAACVADGISSSASTGVVSYDDDSEITVFDADPDEPPQIPLRDYIDRWVRFAEADRVICLVAYIYMHRCGIPLTPLTKHRMMLAALLLAVKARNDKFYSNAYYAAVGGVAIEEINRLERAMILALDWRMEVSPEQLDAAEKRCTRNCPITSDAFLSSSAPPQGTDRARADFAADDSAQEEMAPKGLRCLQQTTKLLWRLCGFSA